MSLQNCVSECWWSQLWLLACRFCAEIQNRWERFLIWISINQRICECLLSGPVSNRLFKLKLNVTLPFLQHSQVWTLGGLSVRLLWPFKALICWQMLSKASSLSSRIDKISFYCARRSSCCMKCSDRTENLLEPVRQGGHLLQSDKGAVLRMLGDICGRISLTVGREKVSK